MAENRTTAQNYGANDANIFSFLKSQEKKTNSIEQNVNKVQRAYYIARHYTVHSVLKNENGCEDKKL